MSATCGTKLSNPPTNSPSNDDDAVLASNRMGFVTRFARRLVLQKLQQLNGGTIELADADGSTTLGHGGDLQATLQVHNPAFFRHAVLGGSLSVAESYLRGDWDCDDLTAFIRIFVRNIEARISSIVGYRESANGSIVCTTAGTRTVNREAVETFTLITISATSSFG